MARATSAAGRVTPSRLWRISPRVRQDGPPAAGSPRTARRQLPDPPHRLLRRVRRRRPALRPARRARGRLADPGGREPRAQARARPLRLGRRHVRRQGRAQGRAQGPRRAARAEHPAAGQAARAGASSATRSRLNDQHGLADNRPVVRARHRAGPQPVVHAGHDRRGHVARASNVNQAVVNGAGLVGKVTWASPGTSIVTLDHRPHDADRRDGERERRQGDRAGRGGPPDRPRARLAVGQGRRPARARPSSPPAPCRRSTSSPRRIPRGHPDRPRDAGRRRRQRQPAGPRRAVRQPAPPRPRRGADQAGTCGR